MQNNKDVHVDKKEPSVDGMPKSIRPSGNPTVDTRLEKSINKMNKNGRK